ncbi:hypothetical protein ACA910_012811 [Epithemia clementina (nom. ined.)]
MNSNNSNIDDSLLLSMDEYSIVFEDLLLRHKAASENFVTVASKIASTTTTSGKNEKNDDYKKDDSPKQNDQHHHDVPTKSIDQEQQQPCSQPQVTVAAAMAMRTRAELLGLLQCARRQDYYAHSSTTTTTTTTTTNTTTTTAFGDMATQLFSQLRLDLDGSNPQTTTAMDAVWGDAVLQAGGKGFVSPPKKTTCSRDSPTNHQEQKEQTSSFTLGVVDVDAFFEEYPEYAQPWSIHDVDDDFDSSSSDNESSVSSSFSSSSPSSSSSSLKDKDAERQKTKHDKKKIQQRREKRKKKKQHESFSQNEQRQHHAGNNNGHGNHNNSNQYPAPSSSSSSSHNRIVASNHAPPPPQTVLDDNNREDDDEVLVVAVTTTAAAAKDPGRSARPTSSGSQQSHGSRSTGGRPTTNGILQVNHNTTTFSYTPVETSSSTTTTTSASSQVIPPLRHPPQQQWQYSTHQAPPGVNTNNKNHTNSTSTATAVRPNPYAPQRQPPPTAAAATTTTTTSSTTTYPNMLPSSWEELHNGLNHFRTAREVDAAVESQQQKNNYQNSNHHRPYSYQTQQHPHHQQLQQPQYHNPRTMLPPPPEHQQLHPYEEEFSSSSSPADGLVIRDSLKRKFQPPKRTPQLSDNNSGNKQHFSKKKGGAAVSGSSSSSNKGSSQQRPQDSKGHKDEDDNDDNLPEELKRFGKELVEKIESEIMDGGGEPTTFEDIAGLQDAKQTIQEVICWPMKRPDLFTGLRRGPNALLLYGPPGTGKTLIGKAIAHESGATFFSISSSSLTSKWIGEGEKLVRTMFAVAAYREPAVVFIDEIDSLLTQRKADENEASRRIKTEFLVQMDGTGTSGQGRVLTIGATNRPQELDEAARRRFVKRLYIPLPNQHDRLVLIRVMLRKNQHKLTDSELEKLAKETDRFSGADLKALCEDAALGPLRGLPPDQLENVNVQDLPPISYKHFRLSLRGMKPSVSPGDLVQYEEWDNIYGSKRADALEEDEDDED